MGIAAQPEINCRRTLIRDHRVGGNERAPGGVTCETRRLPVAEALAQARPQSVGCDQREAALLERARGAGGDRDALAVLREVLDPGAELKRDIGMLAHGLQQHGLQVAAMDDPIGRAVALGRGRAERRPRQHPCRPRVPHPELLRNDHVRLQPPAEAERKQDA